MNLTRLKTLSGLNESKIVEDADPAVEEVVNLFFSLLDDLDKEYPDDETLSGIAYHYRESLENMLGDIGYHEGNNGHY